MKPRMPRTVKVGPHTYRIVLKPASKMPKHGGIGDFGTCVWEYCEIWIKQSLKRSLRQETLWHEVKHARTYPEMVGKRFFDEEFIDRMSPRELAVFQANPDLVEYLTK